MSQAGTPSFRRMDFFDKSIEGVRDTSIVGALVSVISIAVMALLFLSELWSFLRVTSVSHMRVNSQHEAREATVHIHITFPTLPCDLLDLEVENIRGGVGLGAMAEQKVETRMPSRDEMRAIKGMAASNAKLTPAGACTMHGDVTIARVGGAIRVRCPSLLLPQNYGTIDHYIHELSFGPHLPGLENPLQGAAIEPPEDTGRVVYTLKVVSTTYTSRSGWKTRSFQFSARSEYESKSVMANSRDVRRAPGLDFTYDFTPVMVDRKEKAQGFLEFITSSCAIVGGVFTMSGLFVGFVQHVKRSVKND